MRCAGGHAPPRLRQPSAPCTTLFPRASNVRPGLHFRPLSPRLRGALSPAGAVPRDSAGEPWPHIDTATGTTSSGAGSAETNGTVGAPGQPHASRSGNAAVPGSGRSNFRSILRQGYTGEMLFVVIGSLLCGGLAQWTVGTSLRRFNPYSFTVTMAEAPGVGPGTPLRMKGVPMGSVLSTRAGLDRVYVEVEVNEAKTIIPRNSRFELTQSGLIPAASIDISPPEGASAQALTALVAARATDAAAAGGHDARVEGSAAAAGAGAGAAAPAPAGSSAGGGRKHKRAAPVRLAGPKDVNACRLQGVLVCAGDSVPGVQGGSMDELMAHTLRGLRQGEAEAEPAQGIVPGRGPKQG